MLEPDHDDMAEMFKMLMKNSAEICVNQDNYWTVTRDGCPVGIGSSWISAVSDYCRVIQEERDASTTSE